VHSYRLLMILTAALAFAHPPDGNDEAIALNRRGLEAAERRDYAEAEKYYRQSAGIYRALGPQFAAHLSIELFNLGQSICGQDKWREGAGMFDESLTLSRRALGPQHMQTAADLNALGNVSMLLGDATQAERLLGEALVIERVNFPDNIQIAHTLAGLSSLKLRANRTDEALPLAEEALSVTLKAEPVEGFEAAIMYQNVGLIHRMAHRPERALPLLRKARAIMERLGRTSEPRYASILSEEGLAWMDDGNSALAERELKRALEMLSRSRGAAFELATAQHNLSQFYVKQRKYKEAEELLTKAMAVEEQVNAERAAQTQATRDELSRMRSTYR
jgi:tetratricopeptide (TPR) repeat protein